MGTNGRAGTDSQVFRGSMAMLVSTGITGLGGFAFWLLAARESTAAEVGDASALFQTVLLANFLTSLGLPVVIARLATGTEARSQAIFGLAVVLRTATSVASISLFIALTIRDDISAPLRSLPAGLGVTMYVWLAVGAALAVIVEVRLVSMRAWGWVIVRASVAAAIRLPLVLLSPFADNALWLTIVAAGAPAITGWVGAALLTRRPQLNLRLDEVDPAVRRYALSNWLGLVTTLGPAFAVPVLVAFQVSSEDHASFSIAWSIALMVFQIPHLTGSVLLSEGTRVSNERRPAAVTLMISLAVTSLATLVAIVAADLVAGLYGDEFEKTATLLPLLMAATIGWAVVSTALALCRLRDDNRGVMIIGLLYAVATLSATTAASVAGGTVGASTAWLAANGVAAVLATVVAVQRRGLLFEQMTAVATQPSLVTD